MMYAEAATGRGCFPVHVCMLVVRAKGAPRPHAPFKARGAAGTAKISAADAGLVPAFTAASAAEARNTATQCQRHLEKQH